MKSLGYVTLGGAVIALAGATIATAPERRTLDPALGRRHRQLERAHPWRAIALWLAFVAAVARIGLATGTEASSETAPSASRRAATTMIDRAPRLAADARVRLPAQRHARARRLRRSAPRRPTSRRALGAAVGGTVELAHLDRPPRRPRHRHGRRASSTSTGCASTVLAVGAAHPRVTIEQTGDISASEARDDAVNRDLHRAELLSIPVTLLVLLFAFGAIVAALVPVVLALTGVVATFGLLGPLSQVFPIDDATKTVMLLIGMAVGVDYALFYVIRSREERHAGLPSHEALERTARTSGRTVVVSGTTVAIAMAGMFVIGADVFNGLAIGAIAVVACAVAGSVTVLPAILELLGTKIDRGRIPYLPHLSTDSTDSRFWPAWSTASSGAPSSRASLSAASCSRSRSPRSRSTSGSRATSRSPRRASRRSRRWRTSGDVPEHVLARDRRRHRAAGRAGGRRCGRCCGSSSSPSRAASPIRPSPSAAADGEAGSVELPAHRRRRRRREQARDRGAARRARSADVRHASRRRDGRHRRRRPRTSTSPAR